MLEWDGGGDTTFVLVHGFLDLAYAWHDVAVALGAHVIAPDLRGHGDSDWIGRGGYYHYMDYVADLDDVIARCARKRVVVVGHSMGGGVASYWAGTRPERVAAVALLEGIGPPDQSEADLGARTAQWIDAWKRVLAKPPRVLASLEDAAARLRAHDPLLGEELALRLAGVGTRAVDGGLAWKHDPLHATMGPYPFRRDTVAAYFKRITAPALVVDGEKSIMNLPFAERQARRAWLARCRYEVLAGAGHMMHRHQPAALAALLSDFSRP